MNLQIEETDSYGESYHVIGDDLEWNIVYDDYTGDWLIGSLNDELAQGLWMETKEDAFQWILERAGIVAAANYNMAPNRTSA